MDRGEWHARRLGGSSTGLPDIIAVNNREAILLSIEAKAGTSDILYVPQDQIQRCVYIRDMFKHYSKRHVIFAFKFMRKKRVKRKNCTVYEHRKLIEYYKIGDIFGNAKKIPVLKCNYDGNTFALHDDKCESLNLPNYVMPFPGSSDPLHRAVLGRAFS